MKKIFFLIFFFPLLFFSACKKAPTQQFIFDMAQLDVNGVSAYSGLTQYFNSWDTCATCRAYAVFWGNIFPANPKDTSIGTGASLILYSSVQQDSSFPPGIYKSLAVTDSCMYKNNSPCKCFQFFLSTPYTNFGPGIGFSNWADTSGYMQILPGNDLNNINAVFNCTLYDSNGHARYTISNGKTINLECYLEDW